jgi:hypothetical protein
MVFSNAYLVGTHQVEMEDRKTTDKPHTKKAVANQSNRNWCLQHGLPNRQMLRFSNLEHIHPAEHKYIEADQCGREYKHIEEPIITLQRYTNDKFQLLLKKF